MLRRAETRSLAASLTPSTVTDPVSGEWGGEWWGRTPDALLWPPHVHVWMYVDTPTSTHTPLDTHQFSTNSACCLFPSLKQGVCLCVCLCWMYAIHMCVLLHLSVRTQVEARGWHPDVFPQLLSLNVRLATLARLAARSPPGSPCFYLLTLGLQAWPVSLAFWFWGIQIEVLRFVWPAPYSLEHRPRPSWCF